jgi:hypothetical protein
MWNKPRFSFVCTSSNRVPGLIIDTVLIEGGSLLAVVPSEMWCPSPMMVVVYVGKSIVLTDHSLAIPIQE